VSTQGLTLRNNQDNQWFKKNCFPSKDLIGLHPAPYIIYKEMSLNFYFVDVNLTPLQPHHKIEKGQNKRKIKTWDVNMIPKMWGWTQLLGNAPQVVHQQLTQQLPFFSMVK
jgi:hypothetical protein